MAIKIKSFSPADLTPDKLKHLSVEESDALFRQWQHERAKAQQPPRSVGTTKA